MLGVGCPDPAGLRARTPEVLETCSVVIVVAIPEGHRGNALFCAKEVNGSHVSVLVFGRCVHMSGSVPLSTKNRLQTETLPRFLCCCVMNLSSGYMF